LVSKYRAGRGAGAARGAYFDLARSDNAVDNTADERELAIRLARRMTDHRVEFRAAAGRWRQVAAHAEHAVAVHRPLAITVRCDRPGTDEPYLKGIRIRAVEPHEMRVRGRTIVFRRGNGDHAVG